MSKRHSHGLKLSHRRRRRFHRPAGTAQLPGTIQPQAYSAKPKIRLMQYGSVPRAVDDRAEQPREQLRDIEVPEIGDLVHQIAKSPVTWLDIDGLGDADVIEQVGKIFKLHPLALEDVVNVHQRPKVEMYGDYLFVIARSHSEVDGRTEADSDVDALDMRQVAMFLGRNFVITFRERGVECFDEVHRRIRTNRGRIRESGADYLLYTLLDAVIDEFFPALEKHGESLDSLDDLISASCEQDLIHRIHNVRSELRMIRRAIWPLRDAINTLIRDSGDLISDETDLYLRDCYDHTVQIIDVIETDRELCADLRDYYLTVVSNRMNQIMKFLTIIATLFIPLTFVAGLYGMNFNTNVSTLNMPELNWTYGYPFALAVMTATTLAMVWYFQRKGWLSS
ncbi:magnesium/cobalt transporter CorA [Aureliella helgolandensis]|uniref:magnesium/cobalt transporter CorA n=1 Tax=Aureliella helgolandensis TaxID=2527968 RepID=UPI0011A8E437|nr:magnesium/cobalt transporter CorA [Aureliella helgolandensis]